MQTFQELYYTLLKAAAEGRAPEEAEELQKNGADYKELECLLHPERNPIVRPRRSCAETCSPDQQQRCVDGCVFNALTTTQDGSMKLDETCCTGCVDCVKNCVQNNLVTSKDSIAMLEAIASKKNRTYALVAPAFLGQFDREVSPGKLRTALKQMGFDGMLEVAVFADILTLKEALEFDKNIQTDQDYQLTSCCCPMWIAMIRKVYHELLPHIPPSVSPMIAAGRTVKKLYPDALTVFIGPCVAKKAEAREADLKGAVDFVLTFEEARDIFTALNINPAEAVESDKEFSSRTGRIYAYAGGVSEAVKNTVQRLNPDRKIRIATRQADGVPACRAMLNQLREGKGDSNFFEGMGCVGGCVGGPKVLIDKEEGIKNVRVYGDEALYQTPIDNPYVIELLHRLGFDRIESLLNDSDIFTRKLR